MITQIQKPNVPSGLLFIVREIEKQQLRMSESPRGRRDRESKARRRHGRSSSSRRTERHHRAYGHRDVRKDRRQRDEYEERRGDLKKYKYYRKRSPSSSSSSSPSSSSSSSSGSSSSVSSSTKRRRNTPHFKFRNGQKLGHKYRIVRMLGTGTFGRVIQCRSGQDYYAVKIIKPVQKYIDSAKTERNIVKALNEVDQEATVPIVRYKESFYHYQYYCLVFQPLGPSLFDIIKQNNYRGYPIRLVQAFARQIFQAVGFMHANNYIHTDLKPQNILLCTSELEEIHHHKSSKYSLPVREGIKLIDFGGATPSSQRHSSIINTRQYRAPEVILQCCDWNELSDVWSIGCIIPELYSGELLFPTHDDLEHLLMILENAKKRKYPQWMAENCNNALVNVFRGAEIEQKIAEKRIRDWKDIKELRRVSQIFDREPQLCDLVYKCLQIDPRKRITCTQALNHPFFDLNM